MRHILIHMILVVTSSWPVGGWEGQKEYLVQQDDPIAHCMVYQDKDLGLMMEGPGCPKHQALACYQRMREVMLLAEQYNSWSLSTFGPEYNTFAEAPDLRCDEVCRARKRLDKAVAKKQAQDDAVRSKAKWNQVMEDCVNEPRGKK